MLVNAVAIALPTRMSEWNVSQNLLIGGNLFLFAVTFISYLIARRGLQSENTNAFIRSIYSSILFKLFICLIAAFIYIAVQRKELNKPAFFTCMGLYLVYTFLEVSILTRLLRRKPNA
ncbi:MAG: hypothetical protein M3Q06_01140 [Bacteroidota bacterium]|nr:hypothetical protein [Bacteroidota bacterium]